MPLPSSAPGYAMTNLAILTRLYAAPTKVLRQFRSLLTSETSLLEAFTVFIQPQTSSMRFRQRWLWA